MTTTILLNEKVAKNKGFALTVKRKEVLING